MTKQAFILGTGADTGGAGIRVAEAFIEEELRRGDGTRWTLPWIARSMVTNTNYIAYDQDLPYEKNLLGRVYDESELVTLNNTMHGHQWYDEDQGKPTLLMHHGLHRGHFNEEIEDIVEGASRLGAYQIGSTVNLELYGRPDLGPTGMIRWAPIPYNLNALAAMRVEKFTRHPDEFIRIGHAPTDRAVKSTQIVIETVKSLSNRGYPVKLVLIERQTHAKTLETKAKRVDVYIDQLKLGYGCNAIESWGMGIPVIAGVQDYPAWREHMVARFECASPTGLPFIEAREDNLEQVLIQLLESRAMYDEWSQIGREHVLRWHSQSFAVEHLSAIYEEVSQHRTVPGGGLMSRRSSRGGMTIEQRRAALRAASELRRRSSVAN